MKLFIYLIFLCFVLVGCGFSKQKQIGESYFLRKGDLKRDVDIGFGNSSSSEGIVGPTVFEVYWNNDFILAKRHPVSKEKNLVEYYILKKVVFGKEKASENMFGPLTLEQFEAKKKELLIQEEDMERILLDDLR